MSFITRGSLFGLIFLILFFIPNLIHYRIRPGERIVSQNKVMKVFERITGVCSLVFTVCWFVSRKWGFYSVEEFLWYLLGSAALILVNGVLWLVYFLKTRVPQASAKGGATALFVVGKRQVRFFIGLRMALAVLPVLLFLLHGITQRYVLLTVSGILFGVGHIYLTLKHIAESSHTGFKKE